ncbi:MAG: urease accessory protein UreF [Oscillospiraceae bacterium]|nr:urease accessory protein UreF [Oscillospiraceae bacterium]
MSIITMDSMGLLNILQICDSLFPVGAFTLSNGLETYVQKDIITSPRGLTEYLGYYLSVLPYNELGAAALAYGGCDVRRLDEIYTACKAPEEIRSGSKKTAGRFFRVRENMGGDTPRLDEYIRLVKRGECAGHQPIAYGLYMSDVGTDIGQALRVYGYSICSAIVTNCVKLVPLSQLEGQRILSESFGGIEQAADTALTVTLDDIGICGAGSDLRAMEHERLYSRQYMS